MPVDDHNILRSTEAQELITSSRSRTSRRRPRAAGVERVTAHSGRVGLASELTSRGPSTTDVILAGNWEDEPDGGALLGGSDRRTRGDGADGRTTPARSSGCDRRRVDSPIAHDSKSHPHPRPERAHVAFKLPLTRGCLTCGNPLQRNPGPRGRSMPSPHDVLGQLVLRFTWPSASADTLYSIPRTSLVLPTRPLCAY